MQLQYTEPLKYRILDPTGNITALVENCVDVMDQPAAAQVIMQRHPEVEQVGFIQFLDDLSEDEGDLQVRASLRMAGGEFCGNASMCAAALCLLRMQEDAGKETAVRLRVSGVQHPVVVHLFRESVDSFRAGVFMPPALSVSEKEFLFNGRKAALPVVHMEGISHVIIGQESPFFDLCCSKEAAGQAAQDWCRELSAEGLGLLFLKTESAVCLMTPLVYIPGSGTLFWEHSCASGSAAVGMYLASKTNRPVALVLQEPGGELRVESNPCDYTTRLLGCVRVLKQYEW